MMRAPFRRLAVLAVPAVLAFGLLAAGCAKPDVPFTAREVAAAGTIDPAGPCIRAGAGVAGAAGLQVAPAPQTAPADPAAQPAPADPAAQPAPADPAAGAVEQPAPAVASAPAAQPAPVPPSTPAVARFAAGVITLSGGERVTLAELARAVRNPEALRELAPGEWFLGADLVVLPGASVRIAGPEARWLKLRSEPTRFVSIKMLGGGLDVSGTCVTSWDPGAQRTDVDYNDGRAFLLARDGGAMTVDRSEVRYLGNATVESYGLSWRVSGTRGALTNSDVSHLYFGLYSHQNDGLVVRDNEIHGNVLYGIDPHTESRNMIIERNVVHDNGKHGIILAEDCVDSVIRDNIVYRNGHHGIVLYQGSDRNTVENNESFLNTVQGINVNESADNIVRGNKVYRNKESGIGVGQTSHRNLVDLNQIRDNKQDGVRLVSEAEQNTVRGNTIAGNARYGIYIDGDGGFEVTDNLIYGSRIGVMLKGTERQPDGDNSMRDNLEADVKVQS